MLFVCFSDYLFIFLIFYSEFYVIWRLRRVTAKKKYLLSNVENLKEAE